MHAILKSWYRHRSVWAPTPSWMDMEKVREDLQTLYQRKDPHLPGLPLATNVYPSMVNNEISSKAEVEIVIRRLRPHRVDGHTHLRVEHFKQWQREAYRGEQSNTPLQREHWAFLVDLVQNMERTGEIPQELGWTILVLIPKGTTNKREIGLVYTLWKVVEALIDNRLRTSLHIHNVLHGFRGGRGMGAATI